MKELTNDEAERFTNVMMEKHRSTLDEYYGNPKEDGLRCIVQTVMADTMLLLEGRIPLEEWERALAER